MTGNVSRLGNIFPDVAIKAPCLVATTANITLSGLQTVDGVALAEGDRVLVWQQSDETQNGIWQASTGNWLRTYDASKNTDFILGTLVFVSNGTLSGASPFSVTCDDSPIIIDTSEITFYPLLLSSEQFVTLKSYGALGNNVHNDTAALLAADAAGGYCFVTPGSYLIDAVVLTNLKGLIGIGRPTFKPSSNVASGVTQAFLMLFSGSGCDNVVVSGLQFSASKATYPNLYLLCASATTGARFFENVTTGGGIGIYGANCINHTVSDNTVSGYATKGISHDGASQNNVNLLRNDVDGTGSNNHAVSFQLGTRLHVIANYLKAGGYFGAGAFQAGETIFADNEIFNSAHEAINTEDTSVTIFEGNIAYWDVAASHDYGMSIFGNAVANQYSTIEGNIIVNSNSAAIGLANNLSFASVEGNLTLNCCRAGLAGAIQLTGSNCLKNVVRDNYLIDTVGGLQRSGVQEVDVGTGLPSLNTIKDNVVEGWSARAIEHVNALTPASIAANTNNYAPTSGRYYENWNISATSAFNLTGMADGWADRVIHLYNGGANTITLKNDVTSSAGNRFFLGADFSLTANISISVKWRSDVGGGNGGWVKV